MTPRRAADLAGMPHDVILAAIHAGRLPAKKYHKRWQIKPSKAWRFGERQREALNALRREFVALYWQGRSVEWLQRRTKVLFEARNIVWPVDGFAEKTIYENLMGK